MIDTVIFDWAGTTVDYGCFAPLQGFIEAFSTLGINISTAEARGPMGLKKIDHIKALLELETVKNQLKIPITDKLILDLYKVFETTLLSTLKNYCTPIPGVLEIVHELRDRGYNIGSTTGYTSKMMDIVSAEARKQGYYPDFVVNSSDLVKGRPYPYMIWENAKKFKIKSLNNIVKVGDTVADIKEGNNAGCITIGIIEGSSLLGLTLNEFNHLNQIKRNTLVTNVRHKFLLNGADYVIDKFSDLILCIDNINQIEKKNEYLLLTPGPLSTSSTIKRAMLGDWCTWDSEYTSIIQNIRSELVNLSGQNNSNYTSVLLQGSGTYCVEAAITTIIKKSESKVLILVNGEYGKRLVQIAQYAGLETVVLDFGEDKIFDLDQIKEAFNKNIDITHFLMVHCETTTGILNQLEECSEIIKNVANRPVFILDAMSSFGGIPIDMDKLGIDVLISSANKCIQGVPGFGFIILNKSLIYRCKDNSTTLSLDLYEQWETMENFNGKWRFTSPTHVVHAFYAALKELESEGGINYRFKRYSKNQQKLVSGLKELGIESFIPSEYHSPIITTFKYPESERFSFSKFYNELKKHGFVIYPGKLTSTETFRIGTIGHIFLEDIENLCKTINEIKFW